MRRLETCRQKDGKLGGCCQFFFENGPRTRDAQRRRKIALAVLFDGKRLDGRINRRSDLADSILVRARIAVKLCALVPALEPLSCVRKHGGTIGKARAYKCGKAFRIPLQTLPPVKGQGCDLSRRRRNSLAVKACRDGYGAFAEFVVLRKQKRRKNPLCRQFNRTLKGNFRLRFVGNE